jgi:hypothetical protein
MPSMVINNGVQRRVAGIEKKRAQSRPKAKAPAVVAARPKSKLKLRPKPDWNVSFKLYTVGTPDVLYDRNQANQKDPEAYKLSQTAQKRRHASLQSSHREEVHTEVEKALQAVGELFVTFRPCHP